jgi:hypothetical protein
MRIWDTYVRQLGALLDLLLGLDNAAEPVHHLLDLGLPDLGL